MNFLTSLLLATSATLGHAYQPSQLPSLGVNRSSSPAWALDLFKNFIVFGDSYSDESRLDYALVHNGTFPPPGTLLPENSATADGGRIWGRYVAQYTDNQLGFYDYAVAGAVCSNNITARYLPAIHADYPDIAGYELPAFLADKAYGRNAATGAPLFPTPLAPADAVYALWIGVNDLGVFESDAQAPGTAMPDYMDCVYAQLDRLFAAGARYFVLLNVPPIDLAPLYANATEGGVYADQYDPASTPANTNATARALRMHGLVAAANALYAARTAAEALVARRWPGAHVALYDVHALFAAVHAQPARFLNGSAPLNVTGFVHHCDVAGAHCASLPSPDSFMWYDELHPTEQVERLVARAFVDILGGASAYATYYDGA